MHMEGGGLEGGGAEAAGPPRVPSRLMEPPLSVSQASPVAGELRAARAPGFQEKLEMQRFIVCYVFFLFFFLSCFCFICLFLEMQDFCVEFPTL